MKKFINFLILLMLISIIPSQVHADSDLTVKSWFLKAEILENGDLAVVEDISYSFNSDFNGIYRDIVLEGHDGVEDLKIYLFQGADKIEFKEDPAAKKGQEGVYKLEKDKSSLNMMIFSPSKNEEKTFSFQYTIKNLVKLHEDIGEFYYKFIGRENETPVEDFQANIYLPQFDQDKIKIFAHGPSQGTINFVDENHIFMELGGLEAGRFIEARILFPKNYVPLASRQGNSSLDKILNEERALIEKIKEDNLIREKRKSTFNNISSALSLISLLVFGFLLKIFRRGSSLEESLTNPRPDDISPAELSVFMGYSISTRTFLATLFDLARKGQLTIEEIEVEKKKWRKTSLEKEFAFNKKANFDQLDEFESFFLDWIFNDMGDGIRVTTLDMERYRENNSREYYKKYRELSKIIEERLEQRNYYDKKGKKFGLIFIVSSVLLVIYSIVGLSFGALSSIATLLLGIGLFIYAIVLVQRPTDKGYLQKIIWKNFKKDFTQTQTINYLDREKVLIYAIALGLAMKDLEEYRNSIASSYYPMYWGNYFFMQNAQGGSQLEDKFNQGFQGSAGTTTGSSIGGGGGFTGGGGGGAGGGGTGGF